MPNLDKFLGFLLKFGSMPRDKHYDDPPSNPLNEIRRGLSILQMDSRGASPIFKRIIGQLEELKKRGEAAKEDRTLVAELLLENIRFVPNKYKDSVNAFISDELGTTRSYSPDNRSRPIAHSAPTR